MKIIAIVQLYNELESGFLEQFCKFNAEYFDEIIAYDDGSTDGTGGYCINNGFHVISSSKNDFKSEVAHKSTLIEKADQLGADFIVSLDADEILVTTREKLESLCLKLDRDNLDGLSSNFINLWRSNCYKRVDSLFDNYKPVKLWKHKKNVKPFSDDASGLHQRLYPIYVESFEYDESLVVLHTGFSKIEHILDKFVRYRKLGQSGFELMRFIDESNLELEKVSKDFLPLGWGFDERSPSKITVGQYFQHIEAARKRVLRPKITVFSLIYKDVNWLNFLYHQFIKNTSFDDVEFYFVANDADERVIQYLDDNYIPYYEFKNSEEHRNEHYINNVYRAYNFGVSKAKGDYVVMLNSDMAFSEGWLDALVDKCEEGVCVSSRLIEQGKLRTGKYGLEKNFGFSWEDYDEIGFKAFAKLISSKKTEPGGLYMPIIIRKSDFERVGGYPEGNIVPGSDVFNPVIAQPGVDVVSGDTAFIERLEKVGIKHITAFDSIVYHFQEGEKRSESLSYDSDQNSLVAICNDNLQGIQGEKVLWGHLLDLPNTVGLDFKKVNGKTPESFNTFVEKNKCAPELVFQNATFVPRFFPDVRTLVYLQDNLRGMGKPNSQQESNLKYAQCRITNTLDAASSYPEYDFDICPVGVNSDLFRPLDKALMREKHGFYSNRPIGIFVGALNEVKGWSEIFGIIDKEENIDWIVVTKYASDFKHPRVRLFEKQQQEVLVELLNCADFFIIGSPVETQCLAAIEAALCNVPVVIKSVGIFSSFDEDEIHRVGYVGHDLLAGLHHVLERKGTFSPRELMIEKGLSNEASLQKWWDLFARERMRALRALYTGAVYNPEPFGIKRRLMNRMEIFYRFKILRPIIGRDTFYSVAEISVFVKDNMPAPVHKFGRYLWRLIRGQR